MTFSQTRVVLGYCVDPIDNDLAITSGIARSGIQLETNQRRCCRITFTRLESILKFEGGWEAEVVSLHCAGRFSW